VVICAWGEKEGVGDLCFRGGEEEEARREGGERGREGSLPAAALRLHYTPRTFAAAILCTASTNSRNFIRLSPLLLERTKIMSTSVGVKLLSRTKSTAGESHWSVVEVEVWGREKGKEEGRGEGHSGG